MAETLPGKWRVILARPETGRYAHEYRSMINLPNGIQARVPNARRHMRRQDGSHDDGHDNWVQFSMIWRRELNLTVIRAWLSKRHAYDQYVMEALSK